MDEPFDQLIGPLTDPDQVVFERGLQSLRWRWEGASDDDRMTELRGTVAAFSTQHGVGATEVGRRVRVLVESARLPRGHASALAASARHSPAPVRNAVASALPPDLRRLVYGQDEQAQAPPTAPLPPEMPAPTIIQFPRAAITQPAEVRRCRNVLLLGTALDHEDNRRLLERKAFTPLRVTNLSQLHAFLDEDVCGIVVARTWWVGIPEHERAGVLQRLLTHSSFALVKLDAHGLPCDPADFQPLLRGFRFEEPTAAEVVWQDGWRVTTLDVPSLERASRMLSTCNSVRLCPAEIDEPQARVLVGAASKHVSSRDFAGAIRLTQVEASQLHGGRSDARVFRMIPDDGGAPLVAKMDRIPELEEEMRRFQRYAARWDEKLRPRLHFHSQTGLILFTLIDSPEAPGRPAPSLEEKLEAAFLGEHWPEDYRGPAEEDLSQLIDRAVRKLQRLNAIPADRAHRSRAWISCEALEATLRKGMRWTIRPPDGADADVFAYRVNARRIALSLAQHATVHGDVHLRNILVRDDREPHFIDYAFCGPGHPCFDLVRLEAAVLFHCLRPLEDEITVARYFRALLDGVGENDLRRDCPGLLSSVTNRIATRASIASREASLQTLAQYGGTEDDYLALKYITACQALFFPHSQKAVVRGLLAALAGKFRGRDHWQPRPHEPNGPGRIGGADEIEGDRNKLPGASLD